MSVREFNVNISPTEAMGIIKNEVIQGSISGTLVDSYVRTVDEYQFFVFILEKYYMRSSNRASLTVTIDNFDGETKVHAVASGGGEGVFFRFDWGASANFAGSVEKALSNHIVNTK
ncbi:DUF6054 family protein [Sporosarcina sp. CAU 1771]